MGGREPARRLVEAYYGSRKGSASGGYKGCGAYKDYRELLAKQQDLDAVYVATPDHWHAAISIAAMRKRKHVFCQKPMTHSIADARRVAAVARETKVATSVPINNPSTDSTKLIAEWIADGAIGPVREVHNWSSRPVLAAGDRAPEERWIPIPEGFDWDMWLGPAPERPFNKAYLPFVWRGWYDFGDGSFGDMGCYSFAGVFTILNLTPPVSVASSTTPRYDETFPEASIVYLNFPAVDSRPALRMSWYDGGLKPPRPKGLRKEDQRLFENSEEGEGILYVGDKGVLLGGFNGDHPRVYPESPKYQTPPVRREHHRDPAVDQWIAACKGGPSPKANFESEAPVTEAFLLGCIAQRLPGELLGVGHGEDAHYEFGKGERIRDPSGAERIQGLADVRPAIGDIPSTTAPLLLRRLLRIAMALLILLFIFLAALLLSVVFMGLLLHALLLFLCRFGLCTFWIGTLFFLLLLIRMACDFARTALQFPRSVRQQ